MTTTQARPPIRRKHAALHGNPIYQATVRQRINADLQRLTTAAGLHAHLGDDATALANSMGRVIFVVAHAARHHGLHEAPEARILASTANALADVVEQPATLQQHRASIISGLAAAQRLLPKLHTWSLAAGAQELDKLLSTGDMGTADVARALGAAA